MPSLRLDRARRMAAVLATLVVVAVVAACGSSGSPDASGSDSSGSDSSRSSATDATASTAGNEDAGPVPSPGCSSEPPAAVRLERRTVAVAELERWYLVTVPDVAAKGEPLPLVIDFHGLAEGATAHAELTGLGPLGEREGFVSVFPQGSGNLDGWAAVPGGSAAGPNVDVDFVVTLLDRLERDLCVDLSRVYAVGVSNGAMLVSMLVCRMADRFAAVAPIAGITVYDDCEPSDPVPALTMHGTADPILMFNGGVGDLVKLVSGGGGAAPTTVVPTTTAPVDLDGPGYPANAAVWADRNGCDPDPTDDDVTAEVLHRMWDCPEGAEVEMYIVDGGGHAWPGSELSKALVAITGYTTFDIDATELVWSFLSAHHRA